MVIEETMLVIIWAPPCENVSSGTCEQQMPTTDQPAHPHSLISASYSGTSRTNIATK